MPQTKQQLRQFTRLTMVIGLLALLSLPAQSAQYKANAKTKTAVVPQSPEKPREKIKEKKPLPFRDKWAVLVGVGRYQDSHLGSIKYAGRNVLTLTKTLCDPDVGRFLPDHVLICTDGKAGHEAIAQAIYEDWLIKKALPSDLIVVYFCMRSCPTDDGKDILLLGSDAQMDKKELTGLSLAGLLGELKRRSQSKNILCLLDLSPAEIDKAKQSCPQGLLAEIAHSTETTILAADEKLSMSKDDAGSSTSYFVSSLVNGLSAGAGALPIETVAGFVSESISGGTKSTGDAQKPGFYCDQPDLLKLAIGQPVKAPGFDPAKVKIGHSIDKLAQTNPELAEEARRMAAVPVPTTQSKIQELIDQEGTGKDHAGTAAGIGKIPVMGGGHPSGSGSASHARQDDNDDDDDDDSGDVDFGPYMAGMKKSIQSKWTPPKGFDEKKVVAVFSIQRDGSIIQPEIVESSGNTEIDASAMKALREASPLPPLPKGAPKHVQIRYQFDWHVNR